MFGHRVALRRKKRLPALLCTFLLCFLLTRPFRVSVVLAPGPLFLGLNGQPLVAIVGFSNNCKDLLSYNLGGVQI